MFQCFEGAQGVKIISAEKCKVLFGFYPKDVQWHQQGRRQRQRLLGHQVSASQTEAARADCADGASFFLCHWKVGPCQQISQSAIQIAIVISSPKFQEDLPSSGRDWNNLPGHQLRATAILDWHRSGHFSGMASVNAS